MSFYTFKPVNKSDVPLIRKWLHQDYVQEWFYGQGLQNTLNSLDAISTNTPSWKHWLAFDQKTPFAYLITSEINKPKDEYAKWCALPGKAITLDLLIGDPSYLGKGICHLMIQQFLLTQFSDVAEVLIDPAIRNQKAIHVYEKAGFKIIGQFNQTYDPNDPFPQCYMMRVTLQELKSLLPSTPESPKKSL